MNDFFSMLFSSQTASVVLPLIIFLVVVVLIVRHLIGFGVMVTLLAFGLIAGFVIANYDVVKASTDNGVYPQNRSEWEEVLSGLKTELMEIIELIKSDKTEHKGRLEAMERKTDMILEQLSIQGHSLRALSDERRAAMPTLLATPTAEREE